MTDVSDEIAAIIDDLRFIDGDLTNRAADLILALKARAEAADKREAALLEPTDAMIEAGEEELEQRRSLFLRAYAADIYRAMVRAAQEAKP